MNPFIVDWFICKIKHLFSGKCWFIVLIIIHIFTTSKSHIFFALSKFDLIFINHRVISLECN